MDYRDDSKLDRRVDLELHSLLRELELHARRLGERVDAAEVRRLLDQIGRSSGELKGMLDAVAEIARLESGEVSVVRAHVSVDVLLDALRKEFEPAATARMIALRIPACDARVHTDPRHLERILQILLGNAIRYTQRGSVEVHARPKGGRLAIEVRDTGPGIAPDRQQEIFEAFVRGNGDTAGPALGLGLAVARRLAHLLGHPLEVESERGSGSVFRVTLPLLF